MTEENLAKKLLVHIKKGYKKAVERFFQSRPETESAYNSSYESALITALETKNFDILSYLLYQGLSHGGNEQYQNIMKSLTPHEQQNLRETFAKYFLKNESLHIMDLMLNSWLHFNSDKKNFQEIQKFYEKLDNIQEIKPLLQVVANAENIYIVFDFKSSSTCGLDPTSFDENIRGLTKIKSGDILVAAKREKEADILGVLAHELAHYAMQLIYENGAKPYFTNDQEQREKFKKIIKEYMDMKNHEPHINVAIKNKSMYLKIAELIVRVPHLIALHSDEPDEKLKKFQTRYKKLFDFYRIDVLPDLRNEFPLMKPKRNIQDLNKLYGVHEEYEASNFTCVESKLKITEIQDDEHNIFVLTEVSELVFASMIKRLKPTLKKIESSFIFIRLDQLMDLGNHAVIKDAFESQVKPKIFVIHLSQVIENVKEIEKFIADRLSATRIVLVSNYKFKLLEKFPVQKEIKLTWDDLEQTSQNEILSKKIEFQGKNVELRESMPFFFHETPLKDILKLQQLKIATPKNASKDSEIYIERTFTSKCGSMVSCEKVLEMLANDRVIVIADKAGMGKTAIARYLTAKLQQSCWIGFLDLKKLAKKHFKGEQLNQPVVDFQFLMNLLILEDDLELKLFHYFYMTGNVIFVLDGFDEISSKFKEFSLKIIDIVKKSQNRLMITTRTHLSKDLEDHLKVEALKLNSLGREDEIILLEKLLDKRRIGGNSGGVDKLCDMKFFSILYANINITLKDSSIFGTPLLVKMISELDEENLTNFNIFTFYRHIVSKKIETRKEKEPLAETEGAKFLTSNIKEIHREKALQLFFDEDFLQIEKSKINHEQITQIDGLLNFDGEDFQFLHRSFAEYFLADFLILNLGHEETLTSFKNFDKIFLEILHDNMFAMTRNFVEVQFEVIEKSLIVKFIKGLKIEDAKKIVQVLLRENLRNLLNAILTNLEFDEEQKLELLENSSKDAVGLKYNLFHYNIEESESNDIFLVLFNWAHDFVTEKKLNKMLFIQKGFNGQTNFGILLKKRSIQEKILEFLLTRASIFLSIDEFKNLLMEKDLENLSGAICLHKTSSEVFRLIWKFVEEKLDVSDRMQLLSAPGEKGFNFLMSAVFRNELELVDCILKEAKKIFSIGELNEYLRFKSKNSDTCFNIAARLLDFKIFEILINFC